MRCPECKHNQKYRDGTRCGTCNYRFVFRKKNDRISDFTFRQISQRLSDDGHQAFTVTQLALAICRHWRKHYLGPIGYSIIILLISVFVGLMAHPKVGLGVFLALSVLAMLLHRWGKTGLPFGEARKLVERYHQAHPIAALADGRAFQRNTESVDLEDLSYAPERILVVERDDLVDMLIRNRFHLNHKSVVVSRTGYPEKVFAACREFLKNHPNTPVQILHDASPPGFALTAQLSTEPKWDFAQRSLVDLGISRTSLQGGSLLPWLPPPAAKRGAFSGNSTKMLSTGHRMPIDYVGPKPLLSLLGTAVVGGALLLAAPDASVGSDISVEADYG